MKNINLLLLLLLLVSGCSMIPVKATDPTVEKPKTEFNLNPETLKECMPLLNLAKGVSFEDVLVWYSKNAQLYGDCKDTNARKLQLIKDLTSNERPK